MRAGGDSTHKALVVLAGDTLAARSVRALLARGFRSIAVTVSAAEAALLAHVRADLVPLARAAGGELRCLVEESPLGTIGAVRSVLPDAADALLVTNVDNVTALDLTALVAHHRRFGAALTIASHVERFPVPFGVLDVREGRVEQYAEKPEHRVRVSSGTYVLSHAAIRAIEPGEPLGAPELCERVRALGYTVAAFEHDAAWIDVNDGAALERARALVGSTAPA